MAWPAGGIPTTNLDAGTDSPAAARPNLLAAVQAVNDIAASRGVANGVASLDSGGQVPSAQIPNTLPAGLLAPYAGSAAPSGWLLCDGGAISRTTYAALFMAIGTAYGAGDGSTTFNVPDLRGRVPAGKDNMGGTAASRLTTAGGGVDGATLGAGGGAESVTLTTAQIPAHTHTIAALATLNPSGGGATTMAYQGGNVTMTTNANAGGGGAHANVQPTLVTTYIIKT